MGEVAPLKFSSEARCPLVEVVDEMNVVMLLSELESQSHSSVDDDDDDELQMCHDDDDEEATTDGEAVIPK